MRAGVTQRIARPILALLHRTPPDPFARARCARRLLVLVWRASLSLSALLLPNCASGRSGRESEFIENRRRLEDGAGSDLPKERRRGPSDPEAPRLGALGRRVGARKVNIESPQALEGYFLKLDALDEQLVELERLDLSIARLEARIRRGEARDRNTIEKQRLFREREALEEAAAESSVRVLHLGDSHIAADYITRTVRARLQARFGDGGRGFVAADQKAQYGGRRLDRRGWSRLRIADSGADGQPLGVSGVVLSSARRGADLDYRLKEGDAQVVIHYRAHPGGPDLLAEADGFELGQWKSTAVPDETRALRLDVSLPPPPPTRLRIIAGGPGAEILGVSFESGRAGVLYDAIGPVGADARTWSAVDEQSFRESLIALAPHLVVLMLGGNDALAIRTGRREPADVEQDFRVLLKRIRTTLPSADCLLFGPMDAAERTPRGSLVTKRYITDLIELERRVALEEGCAFWDAYAAMGGEGSFGRWLRAGLMNSDLIHPRSRGGDLIGHLFAQALSRAYLGSG